jgi:hypothetical protein
MSPDVSLEGRLETVVERLRTISSKPTNRAAVDDDVRARAP